MAILPRTLDNSYRGQKIALWIFGFIAAVKLMQSASIIFNSHETIIRADGIPLDSYPAAAAQNIVALFAVASISRAVIMLLCLVALVRYRAAISFMFLVLVLNFAAAQLLTYFVPLARVGTPIGVIVNLIIFGLTVAGFTLSLVPRRTV